MFRDVRTRNCMLQETRLNVENRAMVNERFESDCPRRTRNVGIRSEGLRHEAQDARPVVLRESTSHRERHARDLAAALSTTSTGYAAASRGHAAMSARARWMGDGSERRGKCRATRTSAVDCRRAADAGRWSAPGRRWRPNSTKGLQITTPAPRTRARRSGAYAEKRGDEQYSGGMCSARSVWRDRGAPSSPR